MIMDLSISASQIAGHIAELCRLGPRVAGSPAEAAGATYIAQQFRQIGLQTEIQEFPCLSWTCQQASLKALIQGRWRSIPVQPNTHSPSTEGEIEAELIYLEGAQPEDVQERNLEGKIGLLFGSAYATFERLVRLCNSGLAALLYVDDRFPFNWRVASGLIAGWIDYLTIPTATIPYMHAWELVRQGIKRLRLHLDMRTFAARSQNVVASWPGRRPLAPLVIGAHHDAVALGAGAEDDGSGVAIVLELARALAALEPLRPICFVTFGWEENLSEGARQYVVNPANKAEKTAVMINFDALGSWLGKNHVLCVGPRQMRQFVSARLRQQLFAAEVAGHVSPFSDQFPFNLLGVPSIWFYRSNFPGSRFFHHSEHDQIAVLDFNLLARTAFVAADIVKEFALKPELPFPRAIPATQQKQLAKWRAEMYDCVGDWRLPALLRPTKDKRRADIQ